MSIANLTHPFERWPRTRRRLALICAIVAAVLPTLGAVLLKPLHEDRTGEGIIEFELAGSVEKAEKILATWREQGVVEEAAFIQGFDLFYPLIYAAALAGGCVAAAGVWRRMGSPGVASIGIAMAWVAFLAAGFDYVENLGLNISLLDEPATPWPQLAFAAALGKFTAITLALLYALSGPIALVLSRRARER